jgi:pyruvate dehydrogenase complex dihydrolipoamide acetyltransferase long form
MLLRACQRCQQPAAAALRRQTATAVNSLHTSAVSAAVQLKMPSLSPTMEEGTIVKWLKNEGDVVEAGDVVCDIQTDKAVVSMEVDDEGVLAKIFVQADSGTTTKVGDLIGIMAEDGEDWKAVAASASAAGSAAPSSAATPEAAPAAATGGSVKGTVINMPSLSPTMTEGTIVKWYKKEGEKLEAGDLLCDIQTDKAVVSMEADDEGVLAKILMAEGSSGVEIGLPIAVIVGEGEDWKDVAIPTAGGATAKPAVPDTPAAAAAAIQTSGTVSVASDHPFVHPAMVGPATALLMSQFNIQPDSLTGSGPKGNIVKADVKKYIKENSLSAVKHNVPLPETKSAKAGTAAPTSAAKAPAPVARPRSGYTDIELTNMRKVIAKRLTDSKQMAPHGYSSATAAIDNVSRLRKDYIKSGFKVSINDFVIKAAATALQYVPQLNVNIINDEVVPMSNIDISVAVATDNGLITPIVKDAANKPVQQISADVKELAGRARENKLKLDEFQGGSFTISNLGMFGIAEFTAIINSPQVAILAVGGGRQIINPDTMKPETVMTSTLSFDRRYIDEALAADFMTVFKTLMERPELLGTGFLPSIRLDRAQAQLQ